MKKLGVLYGFKKSRWIGHKTDELIGLLDGALNPKGIVAHKLGLMDVVVEIRNNTLRVYDAVDAMDLSELSGIYVANWRINPEIAMSIVTYLQRLHIPVINPEIGRFLPLTKLGESVLLSDQGIPLPDSVFMRHKHIRRAVKSGALPFQYPFIVKATNGSMGSNNWLVKSDGELLAALEEDPENLFVLQQFIPNTFDYRVLVFAGKAELVIKRSRTSEETHLNNTSKGGDGVLVQVEAIEQEIIDLSLKAAHAVGRSDLAGVDVIIDSETNKPYVLEVNKSPQIETGSNVGKKLEVFSKFIVERVDGK